MNFKNIFVTFLLLISVFSMFAIAQNTEKMVVEEQIVKSEKAVHYKSIMFAPCKYGYRRLRGKCYEKTTNHL